MQERRHRPIRIVIETRHIPRIDTPIGQHTIPALPRRRSPHTNPVQPRRTRLVEQHAVRDIGMARARQGLAHIRGACEPGADFKPVEAHEVGEAGCGVGQLRGGEEREGYAQSVGGLGFVYYAAVRGEVFGLELGEGGGVVGGVG